MENTNASRLHPLLTAAAISVTVFSAVGVGALTGLVPHSIGSQKDAVEQVQEQPRTTQEQVKPVEPVITQAAPKPAVKPVVKAKPRKVEPVVYREFADEPRLAQAAPQVEAPKPVEKIADLATIEAVREVKEAGQHTGLGPIAGGIAGAVLGDQIGGKGNTRKVLTVLGAAGGAYAGREIEKRARSTTHWEIDVRRDDGGYQTVRSETAPPFGAGQRVRFVDGRLQPV